MNYEKTLEAFIDSDEFNPALAASTNGSYGVNNYSIELFPDGSYRCQPTSMFVNRYKSPGIILPIPVFKDGDWLDWQDTGKKPYDYDGSLADELRRSLSEATIYG